MNKETNIYSFADECYVFYGDYKRDIEEMKKEIERLNNIINEARKKINSMFDYGDETRIIEDLLELDKILKNYKAKENNK